MNSNTGFNKNHDKKTLLLPSKVNIRSRNVNQKLKARQTRSIDESSVVRYGTGASSKNAPHPLLPKKFTRNKEPSIQGAPSNNSSKGGRLLHSSFYMHKLHNRASTSVQGSRAESQSRHS